MSNQIKPIKLNFFLTPPHTCPYISEEEAQTLFLSPEVHTDTLLYSALIDKGFRRSGEHIYRPHCKSCNACISIRIPVEKFKLNKQQKRCLKKATIFNYKTEPAHFNQLHYQLFDKYISTRHQDGDMYPTSVHQYKEFLLTDWLESNYLNFFDIKEQKLVATCVYDNVNNGVSAVYTYFDPDYSRYSLGRLAILKLIEIAKQNSLDYVYLGYWIKSSQKMAYKGEYRPLECFVNDEWRYLS
ncbi:arginyltransferase [Aliikangiella sp. IMCC44359]|uniref:arginyltransferase n=1 Tax=Aliikangiella sp. IMCC44359 TaxID=3459125 RepID=UPI00403B004E